MFDDSRWGDDPRDDDPRGRDNKDLLTLGRGASSTGLRGDHSEDDPRSRDRDVRGLERYCDSRERGDGLDPRDVFVRDLDLPRGAYQTSCQDNKGDARAVEARSGLRLRGTLRVGTARGRRFVGSGREDSRESVFSGRVPGA
jgi:hypothetical protein